MDIVVHASLREGLARVLPQALIAGKPVVSYDVDGAREVVIDRRDRLLAAARGDRPNWPTASSRLAADAGAARALGARAAAASPNNSATST